MGGTDDSAGKRPRQPSPPSISRLPVPASQLMPCFWPRPPVVYSQCSHQAPLLDLKSECGPLCSKPSCLTRLYNAGHTQSTVLSPHLGLPSSCLLSPPCTPPTPTDPAAQLAAPTLQPWHWSIPPSDLPVARPLISFKSPSNRSTLTYRSS